eukprot:73357-Prorocentrum_minimum.AAC.7
MAKGVEEGVPQLEKSFGLRFCEGVKTLSPSPNVRAVLVGNNSMDMTHRESGDIAFYLLSFDFLSEISASLSRLQCYPSNTNRREPDIPFGVKCYYDSRYLRDTLNIVLGVDNFANPTQPNQMCQPNPMTVEGRKTVFSLSIFSKYAVSYNATNLETATIQRACAALPHESPISRQD